MPATPIRELFDRAQPMGAIERAAFLDQHCQDPQARALLKRLLNAADTTDNASFLVRNPAQWSSDIGEVDPRNDQLVSQSIGLFRIEALLGEGGSARVFRATRSVEGVIQTVALKVLRHSLTNEHARLQFDRERNALVRLVHPNIAQFIDGGISEQGEAYIALEYVNGVQLLQHARERDLPFRDRLRLMIEVARAVSAAHRSLIVHRDLKPANVLVTQSGEVKLLDFGIAKLLELEPGNQEQTQTQFRAFTPAYAAPEQREGGAITTATDVYALGVLLGELLTGERPTDGSSTPSTRIQARTESRGSTASARRTQRWLRGDLDNILLKATATTPDQRYETAAAFAEDIERLLAGQPVHAHPPSGWYRMRKFVVRHRGSVVTGLLLSLGVLAALAVAVWQANLARQEAERARVVSQFLVGLFRAAEDRLPRHQRPTPQQLVEAAMTELASNNTMDSATRAEVEITLGEVSRLSARYGEAQNLFRAALSRLSSEPANDPRRLRARLSEAQVLQQLGENTQSLAAIATLRPLFENDSPDLQLSALAIETDAYLALAKPKEAIDASRKRQQLAHKQLGPSHIESLRASLRLGTTLVAAEQYRSALSELDPALSQWRASSFPLDRDFMAAADAQAGALYGLGELDNAEARLEDLLKLQHTIYQKPHDQIAITMRSYAAVLSGAGHPDRAIDIHRDSIAMLRQIFGDEHEQMVLGHTALAVTLANVYRLEASEKEYLLAIAICDRTKLQSPACPRAHNSLGMTYYRQQRYPEARSKISAALQRYREIYGEQHLEVAMSLSNLASVATAEDKVEEALALSRESLSVMKSVGMVGSREEILARHALATALWTADQNDEALREITQCIADFDRIQPGRLNRRTIMRIQRAQILHELGQIEAARQTAEEAIALGAKPADLPPLSRQLLRELSGRPDLYPETEPGR